MQLYTAIDRRIQALKLNQQSNPSLQTEEDSNDYEESKLADEEDSRSEDASSSICQSRERRIERTGKTFIHSFSFLSLSKLIRFLYHVFERFVTTICSVWSRLIKLGTLTDGFQIILHYLGFQIFARH